MKILSEMEQMVERLDNNFLLAPNDDSYLRILVKDTLEFLRTGKDSAARGHENHIAYLKKQVEGR